MKKKPSEPLQRRVQRESVRRAQQTAKRQAGVATHRVIDPSSNVSTESGPFKRASRARSSEVSVSIPRSLRRGFVFLLVVLGLGLVGYVIVTNTHALLRLVSSTPQPVALATITPTYSSTRIGLISGHRGNDSGTVCPDGLTEAQVNFNIAMRVAQLLRAHGYTVDILDEFDPRLKGYRATLLLSIHADSCTYINDQATGFKVARADGSAIPSIDDHLAQCIRSRYQAATGLRYDASTITSDMTQYHAFYEIDAKTPAAIIETGFLYLDRDLLTHKSEQVAQGIYNGILCFVRNESP